MFTPSWLSIIPPVLAIGIAIWSRQVYISLFAGLFLGWMILAKGNPWVGFVNTVEGLVRVFFDAGNTKVIIFCGLVGGLIFLTQYSGGVDGFVDAVLRQKWLRKRKTVQLISGLIGCLIFVETSISCLVVGAVSRPIFDRNKISREKLAYICDSTSAPVNLLVPFNAWGAFIIGLLSQNKVEDPVGLMISALPLNFYSLLALTIVFALILSGRDFGPMKIAEKRAIQREADNERDSSFLEVEMLNPGKKPGVIARVSNMVIPLAVLIGMMPIGLLITGKGHLRDGSGTTAVYWSVLVALLVASVLYVSRKVLRFKEISNCILKGIGAMVPLMVLMVFAFALGDVTAELGTGIYVAKVVNLTLNPALIPLILFLVACFTAFSTGTSWGTYAIIVPIAISVASHSDVHMPLALAAVLGGGLFGDHCSPISDTTLVASLASSCNHIDHVRTQLPYALVAAAIAAIFYLFAGWL